jgi:hypothetical protein
MKALPTPAARSDRGTPTGGQGQRSTLISGLKWEMEKPLRRSHIDLVVLAADGIIPGTPSCGVIPDARRAGELTSGDGGEGGEPNGLRWIQRSDVFGRC